MGLDGVELVLEVEESFNISFPDEEASNILTTGQLYEAILRKLPSHEERFCLSAVTFYKVRRAIMLVAGKPRSEIRPTTKLQTLFPKTQRKKSWRKLRHILNLRLPSLESPVWTHPAALVSSIIAMLLLCNLFNFKVILVLWLPGVLLLFFFSAWIINILLGTGLREEIQTVGGFTRDILARNFKLLSVNAASHYHDEVWQSVRILVSEQLGVDINKVTKEARFVADLGMN